MAESIPTVPDVIPQSFEGTSFEVNPDRVSFIIRDGIPCHLIVQLDNQLVVDLHGAYLRGCGYVEEWTQRFLMIQSEAKKLNRKIRISTISNSIGPGLIKESRTEVIDTRALVTEYLILKNENKKIKAVLHDAGLSVSE